MNRQLLVVRFALIAPISARRGPLAAGEPARQGQTNSQWNTMSDEAGWLTTSNDDGGDGPHGGGDGPRRG